MTGIVVDENNKPVPFANVYESDAKGTPLYVNGVANGMTVGEKGLFALSIKKAVTYVTAAYSGADKVTKLVVQDNLFYTFQLKTKDLPGVTVTAKKKSSWGIWAALAALVMFNQ